MYLLGENMNIEDFKNISKKTERLLIHSTKIEDFDVISKNLESQLPQQNQFDDEEINLAQKYSKHFCKSSISNLEKLALDDKAYLFRIFHSTKGDYLGGVIIKTIVRKNYQWAEIGYWILNQHWGHGFGSEFLKASIEIAFNDLKFNRIEAHINTDNISSIKTAELAGMKKECIREKFIFENEVWTDHLIYVSINKNKI